MTEGQVLTLLVTVVGLIATVLTVWWRVESKISEAKDRAQEAKDSAQKAKDAAIERAEEASSKATGKADAANAQALLVAHQLSEYKTHVAETYITKAGMREMRDEIMTGVRELKGSVSTIHDRINQIILAERQQAGGRSARSPPS